MAFCRVLTTGTEETGGLFAFVFDFVGGFEDLLYREGTARVCSSRSDMATAYAREAQVRRSFR
jgi:hypothetical protein